MPPSIESITNQPTESVAAIRKRYPAIGKLYFRIPVVAESPIMIGSGESENSDIDILRVPVGLERKEAILIPATSLIGVFRSYLEKALKDSNQFHGDTQKQFYYLFGHPGPGNDQESSDQPQSALQCKDIHLLVDPEKIKIRDGVAINPQTNIADENKKYSYEVFEWFGSLKVELEITIRNEVDPAKVKQFIATICQGIIDGHIRLGAMTNKGFGRLNIPDHQIQMAELNLGRNKDHVLQWLTNDPDFAWIRIDNLTPLPLSYQTFQIDAFFRIKSSLLIKSYDVRPEMPDATHMQSNGEYVLPGASLMGAIRHRARKILQTIGLSGDPLEKRIVELFGSEGEKKTGEGAQKGNLRVEEHFIQNPIAEIQTRIKIDRFTGGTLTGALFEMMPLWRNGDQAAIHITMTLRRYSDWQAALLLFILKDLWTGDLAIGGEKNVGRGVLEGASAEITIPGKETVKLKGEPTDWGEAFSVLENLANKINEVKSNDEAKK